MNQRALSGDWRPFTEQEGRVTFVRRRMGKSRKFKEFPPRHFCFSGRPLVGDKGSGGTGA